MQFGNKYLSMSSPHIMGVINITPDSFSDGGKLYKEKKVDLDLVGALAATMQEQGASFLDVGGESTRPAAQAVSVQEELDRVIPVIEYLARQSDCVISVDTSQPQVMLEAASVGAGLINDVRALQLEGALAVAARLDLPVCLMHMQGTPVTMQKKPSYKNIVQEVRDFLQARFNACIDAGMRKEQIIIDPGFGFGKTTEHNLALLHALESVTFDGLPMLVGMSRKTFIGNVLDKPVEQRLYGSLATVGLAVAKGAKIIRVHDVAASVEVLQLTQAVCNATFDVNS